MVWEEKMKGFLFRQKIRFLIIIIFIAIFAVYSYYHGSNSAKAEIVTSSGLIFENGFIIDYEGTNSVVTIPKTIEGQAVKGISTYAFSTNEIIKEIIIAEGITSIQEMAFSGCINLQTVTVPSTVNVIQSGAFAGCESLANIILAETNTSFKVTENALYNYTQTELIQYFCASSETTFTVPETVIVIDDYALGYTANLETILIGSTAVTFGDGVFTSGYSLLNIDIDIDNPNYMSVDGVVFTKDQKSLYSYPANKPDLSYTVPDTITTLSPASFSGCSNLKTLNISNSVSETFEAFLYCNSITEINVDSGNSEFSSSEGLLLSKDGSILIYYPGGRTETEFIVPSSIERIGSLAFATHSNIQSLILQNSVNKIEYMAIYECPNLTKVLIPTSVVALDYLAVLSYHDSDILSIWGYSNTAAQEYAASYNINFVAIGSSSDWTYTPENTNGTCTITEYKGASTDVYVPSIIDGFWVDEIAHTAFESRSDIEYLTFNNSIKTIEASDNAGSRYIFQGCTNLREIYLPASLLKFTTYTAPFKPFKGCDSLVNIFVDDKNTAFYDKSGVLFFANKSLLAYPSGRTSETYTIPEGTTGISYSAFNNPFLKTVTIPGTVSSLSKGDEATFKNNITTVYINEGVKSVGDIFSQSSPMDIYFPQSVNEVSGFTYDSVPHTFIVYDQSAAHIYADANGITYLLKCIVKFESNDGPAVQSQIVMKNSAVSEPLNIEREGYVLIGWYTDAALTKIWNFAQDKIIQNTTLYAKWVDGYPIIYHLNGGVNNSSNPDYYATGTTVFLKNPSRTDYAFDGWYTNSSCDLKYKFEAIETTTRGTVELWADWWVITPPQNDDDDTGGSSASSAAISDERHPEFSYSGFPDVLSFIAKNQEITVSGKIAIEYANVDEISASYSGISAKLYKYKDGDKRLSSYNYTHVFELAEIDYNARNELYSISIRLATGEIYQYFIPIYKYRLVTEALNAPSNIIYMSSEKVYELRTMAIARNSFNIITAFYESLTPEICSITNDKTLDIHASGVAQIKTKITLDGGSDLDFISEFNVIEKTASEPVNQSRALMCPCYGEYCTGLPDREIDPALIILIEEIQEATDQPIYIISGYRCSEYNKNIGGERDSEHVRGTAADLWSDSLTIDELYDICDKLNINGGVGKYPTYIHIDTRGDYVRWEEK